MNAPIFSSLSFAAASAVDVAVNAVGFPIPALNSLSGIFM